jgi:hypothetical protein
MADEKGLTHSSDNAREVMEISSAVHPEDILKTIDAVKGTIADTHTPGFLDRILIPGAKDLAHEIQEVKSLQIKARRVYMERLASMIDTYVSVHEADLKIRKKAFLEATFAQLLESVNRATEGSFVSFWETFDANYSRIDAFRNLTPEQKKAQLEALYVRTEQAQRDSARAYDEIFEALKKEVISVVTEVERR